MQAPLIPGDGKHAVFWDSASKGTYKQPDNLRRIKRQAKRDFSARQIRRAVYKQKHEGYANGLR